MPPACYFVSIAVMTDELSNLAARRVSMAPFNRANLQSRSMSWRNGSVYWARLEGTEHFKNDKLF